MRLNKEWYDWLKIKSAKRIQGDGYVIEIISPSTVKYREGERTLTLSTEPLMHDNNGDKHGWTLVVYVQQPLKWDEPAMVMSPSEADRVMARIQEGLNKKVGRYDFVDRSN
jgi:hypothetical protein